MAIGDQADFSQRLQNLIPPGWYTPGLSPVRDAVLSGTANAFAFIYSLLAYVRLQTRIATATDGWLDLISYDFFANNLLRLSGQSDASFRNQIIANLFRERNTRDAISDVIEQLIGAAPTIVEPQRAADTGVYSNATTMAYGVAGMYGSMSMPLECFVTVNVPRSLAIAPPLVAGYGVSFGAYGTPSLIEYIGAAPAPSIPAADIYAALDSVRPVTGVIWTQIIVS